MNKNRSIRGIQILAALLTFMLLPSSARAVRLFEGNVGYEGDWLHVLNAGTMSDRVYWYDSPEDATYQVQFARDEFFTDVVSDMGELTTNYVSPGLAPGFYYFRVRATDFSGNTGSWSNRGTLEVVEDVEAPQLEILSPAEGQTYSQGDVLAITLEVSDDTVLNMARFTIDGSYAGVLGLKTENFKIKPSFGEPRTVVFEYPIPSSGGSGPMEISVKLSDVTYNAVVKTVVINTGKGDSTVTPSRGRGRKKN